jgi:hypothetical protein
MTIILIKLILCLPIYFQIILAQQSATIMLIRGEIQDVRTTDQVH